MCVRVLVSSTKYNLNDFSFWPYYTTLSSDFGLFFSCFSSFLIPDINECHVDDLALEHYDGYSHNCHADANCTNTKGSFYCTCHTGYSGDGVTCLGTRYVHNEVLFLFSEVRTHFLICPSFFVDVDECFSDQISDEYLHLAHNCHADANCTNTKGSFYCMCLNGYSGNGVTCVGESIIG